ncbi:hypothetical protein, partial [Streptomyces sp. NPDC102437]|uniref:hypothetical protein n=1 Tax=Streptomyces sp. NPDC102437 TaxID=3366175 RepID=UPI00382BF76B
SGRPRIATGPAAGDQTERKQWQSPFGAAEDRNNTPTGTVNLLTGWQSPFGAAEDRNRSGGR